EWALLSVIQLEVGGGLLSVPTWALAGYLVVSFVGAVSTLGLLLWKRWGLYGLCASYAVGFGIIFLVPHARIVFALGLSLVPLLCIGLVCAGVARHWRYFELDARTRS